MKNKNFKQDLYWALKSVAWMKGITQKPTGSQVEQLTELFLLSDEYVSFLRDYGRLNFYDVNIYGVYSKGDYESLKDICSMWNEIGFPIEELFIPIEYRENGWLSVQVVKDLPGLFKNGQIVQFPLEDIDNFERGVVAANSFYEYVAGRIKEAQARQFSFQVFKEIVSDFDDKYAYSHTTGGSKPKGHVWRPYRFCVRDVVLGVVASEYDRANSIVNVGTFITYDTHIHRPDEGAIALLLFLISEAFMYGGKLEVRFNQDVEGRYIINKGTLERLHKNKIPDKIIDKLILDSYTSKPLLEKMLSRRLTEEEYSRYSKRIINCCLKQGNIPASVRRLSARFDIFLSQRDRLISEECKQLYLALTAFDESFSTLITNLNNKGVLSTVRTCFLVNKGVWSRDEMEMIVRSSAFPSAVLEGTKQVEYNQTHKQCVNDVVGPLLASIFERKLQQVEYVNDEGITFELEDDKVNLNSTYISAVYGKVYLSEVELNLPWLDLEVFQPINISPAQAVYVLIRPRLPEEYNLFFSRDLSNAVNFKNQLAQEPQIDALISILVSSDFRDSPMSDVYLVMARNSGIPIVIAPESLLDLQTEAMHKLEQSYLIRNE